MHNLQITARGLTITDPIRSYINKKISKIARIVKKDITVHCEIITSHRKIGLTDTLIVEFSISLPKAYIKVEKEGHNFYEVIDELEEVLKRQVTKYKGKTNRSHKKIKFSEAMLDL